MGNIRLGVPKDIVKALSKAANSSAFVETGTSLGSTAIWASTIFNKVYTIEILPQISQLAQTKYAKGITNINFLVGDSINVLPKILPELSENTIFWLDGHYSGQGTGGVENECPVIDEIRLISKCKDAIILIDDSRCFLGPLPKPHNADHWPPIAEVFSTLKECFPSHYVTIVDDVVFCIPQKLKPVLDDDWIKYFNIRFKGKKNNIFTRIYWRLGILKYQKSHTIKKG